MSSIYQNESEFTPIPKSAKTFSILCPSRKRPESLRRLLDSIKNTASNLETIEVLIYLDHDDEMTHPSHFGNYEFAEFFRGARVWMSLAQNFLYANSTGMIIMACADDFVFKTNGWDLQVLDTFRGKEDPFWLVYGNDLGKHAGIVSTHFFLHRNWPAALGYWVHSGRNSLWDLWVFEIATDLGRVCYLEEVIFEHLNFRQSASSEVFVDQTTIEITNAHASFRPRETYKLLERERRIDLVIISDEIAARVPLKLKYLLSEVICSIPAIKRNTLSLKRLRTLTNLEIIRVILNRVISFKSRS